MTRDCSLPGSPFVLLRRTRTDRAETLMVPGGLPDECFVTYRSGEDLVSLTPTSSSELPSSSSAVERFSILRLPHLRGVALMDLTNLFEFSSRDCSSFSQEISAIAKIRIENTIV